MSSGPWPGWKFSQDSTIMWKSVSRRTASRSRIAPGFSPRRLAFACSRPPFGSAGQSATPRPDSLSVYRSPAPTPGRPPEHRLSGRASEHRERVLSHSVRPFGNTCSLLAIDLRDADATVKVRRRLDGLPMVVTVQGTITMRGLNDARHPSDYDNRIIVLAPQSHTQRLFTPVTAQELWNRPRDSRLPGPSG
jgi:hypothetical protein